MGNEAHCESCENAIVHLDEGEEGNETVEIDLSNFRNDANTITAFLTDNAQLDNDFDVAVGKPGDDATQKRSIIETKKGNRRGELSF